MHGELIAHRQNVDKIAEQQQSKYLDLYTILPSEISMQLAEVALALGSIEDQVHKQSSNILFQYRLNCCFNHLLYRGVTVSHFCLRSKPRKGTFRRLELSKRNSNPGSVMFLRN